MRSPWHVLGIAATSEHALIRAAYARRLKQIDVDEDPAAFIALREAYEHALAFRPAQAVVASGPDWEAELPAGGPAARGHEPVRAAPAPPEWLEDLHAIDRLVDGTQSRESIFQPVRKHLDRVLTHPDMMSIDHAAQIEEWAAHRILSGLPRTNALIGPCIDQFRWDERIQFWNCPPAIRHVMRRNADNSVYATLLESPSRTGKIFRKLADPAGRTRASLSREVQHLLDRLRGEHPTILLELPAGNVDRWDELAERQWNTPLARTNRWLDARWAQGMAFCRRFYLDRILLGLAIIAGMLALVLVTLSLPILFLATFRGMGMLANKFGTLLGDGYREDGYEDP